MTPNGYTPLIEAQHWLRRQVDEGAICPCCQQFAKVYRRKVNHGMARSLILMYRLAGQDWVHVPTKIGGRSREEGKLAYWGLVEPDPNRPRGWWRVTGEGADFVTENIKIAKYALIYDGKRMRLDYTETVGIRDALGTHFDYDDLMAGR